jgi:hypothetical protein
MTNSREQRRPIFIKAHIRTNDDWLEVAIGNVSLHGLMVKCSMPPGVGETVEIRRRGVCVIGQVTWRTRTRCGIRCQDEIDHTALLAEHSLQLARSTANAPAARSLWHWRRRN